MPINGPWGSSSGFNRSLECSSGCRWLLELLPQAPQVWGSHKFRGGAHPYLSEQSSPPCLLSLNRSLNLQSNQIPGGRGPRAEQALLPLPPRGWAPPGAPLAANTSAFLSSLGNQKRRFEAWLCPSPALGPGSCLVTSWSLLTPVSPRIQAAAANTVFSAPTSLV